MAEMNNKHNTSHKIDDIIETNPDVHDINTESRTNSAGKINNLLIDSSPNLTEVEWQRSEDGSYSPSSYINRDLSLLQFHLRVLAQAADPRHPLLERLFFLMIFSSNLDEFFEIRVAGIMQKLNLGDVSTSVHGMRPSEILNEISAVTHDAIDEQYRILNEDILPALALEDIRYLKRDELNAKQSAWMKRYFIEQVSPVLTPISIDPAHPFPRLVNKSLNFIATLDGKDAFGRDINLAIVPAPRSLPRVIRLPDELTGGKEHHIMLSAVIHEHVGELFPGVNVTGCHQFRLTRNADLDLADDVEDIAKALEGELENRRFGDKVRLEVTTECPTPISDYLLDEFDLHDNQLYRVNGPVNLTRLLFDFNIPALRYKPFTHIVPKPFRRDFDKLDKTTSMFAAMRKGDVLVHHPFHAFSPVVNLLWQAANDPKVLAIKQTLYRSGTNSEIVQALAAAARNGKEVTAVIELRARFDEASNIAVANYLQEAGAVVVYGIVGYKTHAKLMLIVRRENDKIRRYVHLGTGNYHAANAKVYTDYGLFSADPDISEDVHKIFNELTGMGKPANLKKLLHAPFTLHDKLMGFIDDEIAHAKAGKRAHIIIKVNALTERRLIDKLYDASQAGVKIELILRSMCCLRPQVKGLSENITVRSVIGRFLEHTRIYYFHNDGDERLYCGSADWMDRNLFHRVEVAFPIEDKKLSKQIYQDGLLNYLQDNTQAWTLSGDGVWKQNAPAAGKLPHIAQEHLLKMINGVGEPV
ncbi:polyphosphate kinase 1 [Psychrobacter sp. DAB_AL62B]|uniref:polyphosphate kinase 1 n=2 Tax=Psychrobacter sp. DAB_AL62B TaxID=1028420 RepID=UPI00238169D0|nr:polyphosphate kinase 1 [Psychrobacter sp. DAB_AL62B]MDE4454917.1 polyphosphate kinase 1 [Psychrobacter sp. DAB_AL62B]